MESGMMGFVPPTNITATREIRLKLEEFGNTIKAMEAELLQELEKEYTGYSSFDVSIKTDTIQIWSEVDRESNTRVSIKHIN